MSLTSERKLYLYKSFPSLMMEEDLPHADSLEQDIVAGFQTSTSSPESFILGYAMKLRTDSCKDVFDKRGFLRSGDFFEYVVNNLSQMDEIPADITTDQLLSAFALFEDMATLTAPHALYLTHSYDLLDSIITRDIVGWDATSHVKGLAARLVSSIMSLRLQISPAAFSYHTAVDNETYGQQQTKNVHVEDDIAYGEHDISLQLDRATRDIIQTTFHEINHTYQSEARLAFLTYGMQIQKMLDKNLPYDEVAEAMHLASQEPDIDVPTMLRMMFCSQEFRFFAQYMELAAKLYPEDVQENPLAYELNPMEIQAFDVSGKVTEYLAATAERRTAMRTQAEQILKNHDIIQHSRFNIMARLRQEISAQPAASAFAEAQASPSNS